MKIIEGLKKFAHKLNEKGIPLPMIRDPKTGLGSVSLTMVVASFTVAILGMVGKISKLLGDIDMTQALWLLGISCSLYFGRRVSGNKDNMEIDNK